MNIQYKEKHENFISGSIGGSCLEICLVTQLAPCFILVKHLILRTENRILFFLVNFFGLIIPLVLYLTVLNCMIIPSFVTFVILILAILFNRLNNIKKDEIKSFLNVKFNDIAQPYYLTFLRGYLLVSTAICILAVDFQVFPRRFVKTEIDGTSLMDMGVGHFVFYGGLVARQARSNNIHKLNIFSVWPLWVLGLARLFSIKSIDYQEHSTEYGIHWNFFMTLALIKTLSDLLFHFLKPNIVLCISFLIPIVYEILLDVFNLKEFILSNDESLLSLSSFDDENVIYKDQIMLPMFHEFKSNLWKLFVLNRSGILSCFGFLGINCIAIHIGKYIIHKKSKDGDYWERLQLSIKCLIIGIFLHIIHILVRTYICETSRRLANLAYIIWTMGDGFITLSTFLITDIIISSHHYFNHSNQDLLHEQANNILSSISYNGLLFFIISNLITGLVNICFETIFIGDIAALFVIIAYMFILSFVASILHAFRLKLKFW